MDAIAPRLGANCPTAGAGRLLDLNPPAACTTNDRCDTGSNCLCRGSQWTSDGLRRYGPNGITNVIPYADIISGGWQHARASSPAMIATAARPVSLADVAVGMPVAGTWVLASNNATLGDALSACAAGEGLACAARTWMASIDTMLLADCATLQRDRRKRPKPMAGQMFTPFPFPRREWLPSSAKALCFWIGCSTKGKTRCTGEGRFQKTKALVQALLITFSSKRYYLKADADALVSPKGLLLFLGALGSRLHPKTPLYFGNPFMTRPSACQSQKDDRCRAFTFGLDSDLRRLRNGSMAPRPGRLLRMQQAWLALQNELMTADELRQSNRTAVTYALGGVYGWNKVALELLMRHNVQHRVGNIYCHCRRAVRGNEWHTHEDANMGLAMHLVGGRLVSSSCFNLGAFNSRSFARDFKKQHPLLFKRSGCNSQPIAIHPVKADQPYLELYRRMERYEPSVKPVSVHSYCGVR